MTGGAGYRPAQFHDLSKEFAVLLICLRRTLLLVLILGGALSGVASAQQAEGPSLDALFADEARAREAASAAWDAAEAADEARDAAAATLERLEAEARAARETAQEAIATLSLAIGRRQAEQARLEDADTGDDDAARLAEEDAARLAAEEEAARLAEEEAARIAAEEEAARIAAEEEAAAACGRRGGAHCRRGGSRANCRRGRSRPACGRRGGANCRRGGSSPACGGRGRTPRGRGQAALDRCLAIAGQPSAMEPISEDAQRELFSALAQARGDCTEAARELPDAGGALFHLGTIAQVTGEHRQAVRLYERAAEAGEVAALTRLGDYYNFGIRPVSEDVDRAVELYEEAVAAGDPAAAATLAMMHRLGRGVPRDPERMIALMQQARRPATISPNTGWLRPTCRARA
jgi:TPR repeat protein